MSRLRRFRALPRSDRRLLLEAALLLALSRLSVRALPFQYIHRFLQARWREHEPGPTAFGDRVASIDRALSRAEQLFRTPSLCLPRSMAAYIMLRRRGVPAVIYLGVKSFPDPSLLDAHAWIDIGNSMELQSAAAMEGYTTVWTIGQHAAAGGSPGE